MNCNLEILNEKFAKGVPTYENICSEKNGSSIIDLVLSSCSHLVNNFKVVDKTLGSTAHSAHKIVTFEFQVARFERPKSKKRNVYGLLRKDNSEKFASAASSAILKVKNSVDNIYNDLNNLNNSKDIYEKSEKVFNSFVTEFDSAKKNILGFGPQGL